ncbi:hypothetical protein VNO80_24869 [Phaseolus coccineus]|uniref:Uncharacterized protein n=1 Tax=Phaseolus coccineus TaxID=3886 RepID=A0AAN9QSS2_PHACN
MKVLTEHSIDGQKAGAKDDSLDYPMVSSQSMGSSRLKSSGQCLCIIQKLLRSGRVVASQVKGGGQSNHGVLFCGGKFQLGEKLSCLPSDIYTPHLWKHGLGMDLGDERRNVVNWSISSYPYLRLEARMSLAGLTSLAFDSICCAVDDLFSDYALKRVDTRKNEVGLHKGLDGFSGAGFNNAFK